MSAFRRPLFFGCHFAKVRSVEDLPLKQRLIGAIVLVALAVIFIPMLLSGRPTEGLGGTNIPRQPADQKQIKVLRLDDLPQAPGSGPTRVLVDRDLPAKPVAAAPGKQTASPAPVKAGVAPVAPPTPPAATAAVKPAPATPPPATADKKTATAAPGPKGWAVQVGSFSRQANALALRDRLRGKHFPAFVDAITGAKGPVYRVRVGPEVRHSGAEDLQKRLSKVLKARSLIVSYP